MSHLGTGVMIAFLGGNADTVEAIKTSIGKTISVVSVAVSDRDSRLLFTFTDGSRLSVWDGGQSCCEHRYMVCADALSEFIGATLLDLDLKSAPDIEAGGESHEVQFLDVKTSKGVFQVANHNQHNGYYGGFAIQARAIAAEGGAA